MSRKQDKAEAAAQGAPPGRTLPGGPPGPRDGGPGSGRTPDRREWLVGLLLLGATLFAYRSLWHAGFIWDDDGHVTRADLRPLGGLWRIWSEPGATQQYYPLLHTAFWLEHRLWADSALGYHLVNVVLHAAAAFLLYRLLRRLLVPGALLAASAFALHPVCVESVAWISEQKNTLSAMLCLAAALVYVRFDQERRARWYVLGFALFAMALAAKSVVATLPAALLVVFWWRRGRLSWKADVLPLAPWFCAGAAAGAVTAWVERTYIGASGAAFKLSLADRVLVAGRALWFYLGKIFWPANLVFIYPHWNIDARAPWQYLFPAAAAAALAALYALRGRMRGPLASALLFAGTLFPALGFFNVYPFVYSYVSDHFQYLAAAVALSATAAALASGAARLPRGGRAAAAAAAVCGVAGLSWLTSRQCAMYGDAETLWRTTIARNPQCWMAYENLGGVFMKEGRVDQAVIQFQGALEINRNDVEALNELAVALLHEGRVDQALLQLGRALQLAPGRAETHINLGAAFLQDNQPEKAGFHFRKALETEPRNALVHRGLAAALVQERKTDEAVGQLQAALEAEPGNAEVYNSLGSALLQGDRAAEAVAQFETALKIDGEYAEAHFNLGNALMKEGKVEEAVSHLKRAVSIRPDFAQAHSNLANALLMEGRADEAIVHYERALAIKPDFAEAQNNLAGALLEGGRLDEAAAHFQRALELEPGSAQIHNDLGAVLMREGRTDEAVAHYRRALEIRPDYAPALVNLGDFSLKHGRLAQAAADYGKALEIEPGNARVHNSLGIALAEEGRSDEAAAQFRIALKIAPDYSEARRNLGIVVRQAGLPDRDGPNSQDSARPR